MRTGTRIFLYSQNTMKRKGILLKNAGKRFKGLELYYNRTVENCLRSTVRMQVAHSNSAEKIIYIHQGGGPCENIFGRTNYEGHGNSPIACLF